MTKAANCYMKDQNLYFGSTAETILKARIDHPPYIRQNNCSDLEEIALNLRTVLKSAVEEYQETEEEWSNLINDEVGNFAPMAGYKTNKEFAKRAKFVLIQNRDGMNTFNPTRRRGERFSFISDWSFSIPDDADDETLAKALLKAFDRCET